MATAAIDISGLSHAYGERVAVDDLNLSIAPGEIFIFLGPNGGGKTTLFRVLTTLIRPQQGDVSILGFDLRRQAMEIRSRLGIVFQAPSLDKKLTVAENVDQQAALYGLSGPALTARRESMLAQLGLTDRAGELAEKLSGGLRRRVELAKGMIHQPRLLLLDEPSTGLDPGARSDMWEYLRDIRDQHQVTIVLTSHLLEEAERADRIAILNEGKLVACDTPEALKATVGGDSITIETSDPHSLAEGITQQFDLPTKVMEGSVRLEQSAGHQWIAKLVEAFPGQIESVRLGKPTLEDVFIQKTGHRFWRESPEASL